MSFTSGERESPLASENSRTALAAARGSESFAIASSRPPSASTARCARSSSTREPPSASASSLPPEGPVENDDTSRESAPPQCGHAGTREVARRAKNSSSRLQRGQWNS